MLNRYYFVCEVCHTIKSNTSHNIAKYKGEKLTSYVFCEKCKNDTYITCKKASEKFGIMFELCYTCERRYYCWTEGG